MCKWLRFFSDTRFHLEERILSKLDCEILAPGLLLWRLCATQVLMIFFLEFCFFSFIFSLQSQMILIYLRSLWEEICRFIICSFQLSDCNHLRSSSSPELTVTKPMPNKDFKWTIIFYTFDEPVYTEQITFLSLGAKMCLLTVKLYVKTNVSYRFMTVLLIIIVFNSSS